LNNHLPIRDGVVLDCVCADTSSFIFAASTHTHTHSLTHRTTYAKVAGKYQDVLTLESSVAELHQMFLDFALLTEQQGELLDQIEFQVKQAGDYVEEANVDIHQAGEYQKAIRKKKCWIMLIVVVAIVVILFATGIISF
jgi:t-SNARE complex subunit (syntaxin)